MTAVPLFPAFGGTSDPTLTHVVAMVFRIERGLAGTASWLLLLPKRGKRRTAFILVDQGTLSVKSKGLTQSPSLISHTG